MEDALREVDETAEVQDGGDPWWLESDPFLENDEGVWSGSQSVDAEPGSPDSALPPESQESQEPQQSEGSESQADSNSADQSESGERRGVSDTIHLGAGAQHAHTPSWYASRGLDPERHARRYQQRVQNPPNAGEQAADNGTTVSVESVNENAGNSTEEAEDVVDEESEGRETAEEDNVSASQEGAEEEANSNEGELEESEVPEEDQQDNLGEEREDGDSGQEEEAGEEELSEQLPSAPPLTSGSDAQLSPVNRTTPAMDDMIQERPLPPTPPRRRPPTPPRRRPTSPLPAPPVPAHGIPLGGLATEREDTVDQPISLGRGGTQHLGAGAQLAHTPSWYEARGLDPDRHERRNSNGRWTSTGWQRQTDWEELHANPHATPSAPSAPSLPLGGIQSSERPYYPPPSSHQSMAQPNHNRSRVPIGNNWDMMRTADNRVRVITSLVK